MPPHVNPCGQHLHMTKDMWKTLTHDWTHVDESYTCIMDLPQHQMEESDTPKIINNCSKCSNLILPKWYRPHKLKNSVSVLNRKEKWLNFRCWCESISGSHLVRQRPVLILVFIFVILINPILCNEPPRFLLNTGENEIVLRLREGPETPVGKYTDMFNFGEFWALLVC